MKLLRNKKFIEIVATITIFIILTAIFYVLSQCISGRIDIRIGVN